MVNHMTVVDMLQQAQCVDTAMPDRDRNIGVKKT